MSSFEERQERTQEILGSIRTGTISTASREELSEYISWLSEPAIQGCFNGQAYPQTCETVRLHLLRALIEDLERRGKTMQWLVVALAVAALIASVVQTGIAIRAELRANVEHSATSQAKPSVPSGLKLGAASGVTVVAPAPSRPASE